MAWALNKVGDDMTGWAQAVPGEVRRWKLLRPDLLPGTGAEAE